MPERWRCGASPLSGCQTGSNVIIQRALSISEGNREEGCLFVVVPISKESSLKVKVSSPAVPSCLMGEANPSRTRGRLDRRCCCVDHECSFQARWLKASSQVCGIIGNWWNV
ncbi:rCG42732 [Rattus norvegicus]|uniref:RCG42732 n=1 Tax=Rattus norvegicus TaxID=10116 RepID=A6K182_RAT|nr:rCG42732 [Rattus norvegicus]